MSYVDWRLEVITLVWVLVVIVQALVSPAWIVVVLLAPVLLLWAACSFAAREFGGRP